VVRHPVYPQERLSPRIADGGRLEFNGQQLEIAFYVAPLDPRASRCKVVLVGTKGKQPEAVRRLASLIAHREVSLDALSKDRWGVYILQANTEQEAVGMVQTPVVDEETGLVVRALRFDPDRRRSQGEWSKGVKRERLGRREDSGPEEQSEGPGAEELKPRQDQQEAKTGGGGEKKKPKGGAKSAISSSGKDELGEQESMNGRLEKLEKQNRELLERLAALQKIVVEMRDQQEGKGPQEQQTQPRPSETGKVMQGADEQAKEREKAAREEAEKKAAEKAQAERAEKEEKEKSARAERAKREAEKKAANEERAKKEQDERKALKEKAEAEAKEKAEKDRQLLEKVRKAQATNKAEADEKRRKEKAEEDRQKAQERSREKKGELSKGAPGVTGPKEKEDLTPEQIGEIGEAASKRGRSDSKGESAPRQEGQEREQDGEKKTKTQGGPLFPQGVDLTEIPPGFQPGAAMEEERKEAERKQRGAEAKRQAHEKQQAKGNTKEDKEARRKAIEAESRALSLDRSKSLPVRMQRAAERSAAREQEVRAKAERGLEEDGTGSLTMMDGRGRPLGKMKTQHDLEGVFLKVNSNDVSDEAFQALLRREAVKTDGSWIDGCTAWAPIKRMETTEGSKDMKLILADDSVVMGQASVAAKKTVSASYETHLGPQAMDV